MGFFCFANGQNNDSLKIKLNELEQRNQKIETKIKKLEVAEKKHETAFYRLKAFLKSVINEQIKSSKKSNSINREAIKTENTTDPVTDFFIPDGVDTLQGSWIYRLFHKDNFILKPYKKINNEKIYLD